MNRILNSPFHGAAQAMLNAVGLNKNNYKSIIGIASNYYGGNPCNIHLNNYVSKFKSQLSNNYHCFDYGLPTVSDGITMGTPGMSYSLPSRELIASSVETVSKAHLHDKLILIPGCDKNLPGVVMGGLRVNKPFVVFYGGSIKPTCYNGKNIDVVDAFKSYGAYNAGLISNEDKDKIIETAVTGCGACSGLYTANSMALCLETMGLMLKNGASNLADTVEKNNELINISLNMDNLINPREFLTRDHFENAIKMGCAMGCSTNIVLHLIAIANECNIKITYDDINRLNNSVKLLGNFKPFGEYHMSDLNNVGGTSLLISYGLKNGLLEDTITCMGNKLGDIYDIDHSILFKKRMIYNQNDRGILQTFYGNIAKNGAIGKITGKEGHSFNGPARVYEDENMMVKDISNIKKGDVVVIRNMGPVGSNGMPEMLYPTATLAGAGLLNDVCLVTDGRFSGGSEGFIIGHVSPESAIGGEIGMIENGDMINVNVDENGKGNINAELSNNNTTMKKSNSCENGWLSLWSDNVSQADEGCIIKRNSQ